MCMTLHHIFICKSCKSSTEMQPALEKLFADMPDVTLHTTRCTRGCCNREADLNYGSIAFVAKGKESILFHKLTPTLDDMDLLKAFFEAYAATDDGRFLVKNMAHPRADKTYILARIPALPQND